MRGVTLICAYLYHRREHEHAHCTHEHAHCTHACWIPWFRLCGLGLTVQAFWFRPYGLGFLVYALGNTNVFVDVVQTPVGSHGKRTPLRIKALWFRLYGLGFMVQALLCRLYGLGFMVQALRQPVRAEFRPQGLGFRCQAFAFWFRLGFSAIRQSTDFFFLLTFFC